MLSKAQRLSKILKRDRKSLIVAFDHGILLGPLPGSENPQRVLEQVVEGGADGVIITPGLARRFAGMVSGRMGVILSIPADPRYVEYAVETGADAVKTTFFGDINDVDVFKAQEDVAITCEKYGLPYLAEVIPAEKGTYKPVLDESLVRLAVRKAAELGADLVKTVYTGNKDSFSSVIASTFIPVVILGGERADDRDVLQTVKDAMDSGAAGVAFGRNIWNRQSPSNMVRAVRSIIHERAQVDEALGLLQSSPRRGKHPQ